MKAMIAKIDSLEAHGQSVAAVINTGDLVYDGQYPAHWERFLRITEPLTSRVPYFPVPGTTSAPTPWTGSRTGAPRRAYRSAAIVSTTASTPPTGG